MCSLDEKKWICQAARNIEQTYVCVWHARAAGEQFSRSKASLRPPTVCTVDVLESVSLAAKMFDQKPPLIDLSPSTRPRRSPLLRHGTRAHLNTQHQVLFGGWKIAAMIVFAYVITNQKGRAR